MRIFSFLATSRNGKLDSSIYPVAPLTETPEPLDTELSPPSSIVGVRDRRSLWIIGLLALILRVLPLPFSVYSLSEPGFPSSYTGKFPFSERNGAQESSSLFIRFALIKT